MTADGKLGSALWEADRHSSALTDALVEWDATSISGVDELEQAGYLRWKALLG
jgi:hypothetical protein